jgi:hypothetical protein
MATRRATAKPELASGAALAPRHYSVFIPLRLPGLNEIIDAAKRQGDGHHRRWNAYNAERQKLLTDLAFLFRGVPALGRIWVEFCWMEPNKRRDPDNIAAGGRKLVLDALKARGVITNDGWAEVAGWSDTFQVASTPAQVGVRLDITEVP